MKTKGGWSGKTAGLQAALHRRSRSPSTCGSLLTVCGPPMRYTSDSAYSACLDFCTAQVGVTAMASSLDGTSPEPKQSPQRLQATVTLHLELSNNSVQSFPGHTIRDPGPGINRGLPVAPIRVGQSAQYHELLFDENLRSAINCNPHGREKVI